MYIVLRILYLVVHISTYFQPAGQLITYFVPQCSSYLVPESTMFFIFCTCLYIVLLYIVLHILYLILLYIVQHLFYLVVQCSTCILYLVGHCSTNFALVVQSSTYFVSGSMYIVLHVFCTWLYMVFSLLKSLQFWANIFGNTICRSFLIKKIQFQSILEEFFFSTR